VVWFHHVKQLFKKSLTFLFITHHRLQRQRIRGFAGIQFRVAEMFLRLVMRAKKKQKQNQGRSGFSCCGPDA